MFKMTSRKSPFGIDGYQTPKIYQDPIKQMQSREKIRKGQKLQKVKAKPHYLNDI